MSYTTAARPIVGILEEDTVERLIDLVQGQWPALFNFATPYFFSRAFLGASAPRLVQPIPCAQRVLQKVWESPASPDLSYLATRIDPTIVDTSKLDEAMLGLLQAIQICVQVDAIRVNFNPAGKDPVLPLPVSLEPLMGPQSVALQVSLWVGMLTPLKGPVTSVHNHGLLAFNLTLHVVGALALRRSGKDLLLDAEVKGVEIVDLKPDGLGQMIKYYLLRSARSKVAELTTKLVLPSDLLSIQMIKDLLAKEGDAPDSDRPSLILRLSFAAQLLPSGPGNPEIDRDLVELALAPTSLLEEIL